MSGRTKNVVSRMGVPETTMRLSEYHKPIMHPLVRENAPGDMGAGSSTKGDLWHVRQSCQIARIR